MLHRSLNRKEENDSHFAVGVNSEAKRVLVQIQDRWGEQARIVLTKEEAVEFANLILEKIELLK